MMSVTTHVSQNLTLYSALNVQLHSFLSLILLHVYDFSVRTVELPGGTRGWGCTRAQHRINEDCFKLVIMESYSNTVQL